MKYHPLSGVPVPLSALVLGTMTFGDSVDKNDAASMIDMAVEAGITGIDTANSYVGGETEILLGEILKDRWDKLVLASKAGMPHPDANGASPLSAVGLRASVEGSLRRLKVEKLDVLYLHKPDREATLVETLTTVAELRDEGKVGALGVSNFAAWQIGDVINVASEVGAPRPQLAQQLYNAVGRRLEDEYLEFARVHQILTLVYNPLAGGLLTGRHSFATAPATGRFADSHIADIYMERYWSRPLFAAVEALAAIASSEEMSLVELAFRWITSKPDIGGMILGGSSEAQLRANLDAIRKGPLESELVRRCDDVGETLRGSMPTYNR